MPSMMEEDVLAWNCFDISTRLRLDELPVSEWRFIYRPAHISHSIIDNLMSFSRFSVSDPRVPQYYRTQTFSQPTQM